MTLENLLGSALEKIQQDSVNINRLIVAAAEASQTLNSSR